MATDTDHWMLYMVLGVASISLSVASNDERARNGLLYVAKALEKADNVLTPGSISGIQAVLFLVQYAMLDPKHFDSWPLIGVASRSMIDLGMHQDPPPQTVHDPSKLDLRRRIYYCVFAMDRYGIPRLGRLIY
jgi:Fungal specific transcription factor domain